MFLSCFRRLLPSVFNVFIFFSDVCHVFTSMFMTVIYLLSCILQMNVDDAVVTTMETNSTNTRLFSADSFGFVCIWNIDGYCVDKTEEQRPER